MYQSLEEAPSSVSMHQGDFNLTGNDHTSIDQSDVIMTFTSHSE